MIRGFKSYTCRHITHTMLYGVTKDIGLPTDVLFYGALDELVKSPPFHGGMCGFDPRMRFHFPKIK